MEIYLHSPNTPSWRGDELKTSTGTLPFTFTFKIIFISFHVYGNCYGTIILIYMLITTQSLAQELAVDVNVRSGCEWTADGELKYCFSTGVQTHAGLELLCNKFYSK
jgi:hypothetical protein